MTSPSDNRLPPKLEQQLADIEQWGNEELNLKTQSRKEYSRIKSEQQRRKRIQEKKDIFESQVKRTKRFGLLLLGVAPLFVTAYIFFAYNNQAIPALFSLLFAGFLIGCSIVFFVISNRHLKEIRKELPED